MLLQGVRADDTVLFRATKPEGGTAIYGATSTATNLVFDFGTKFINPFSMLKISKATLRSWPGASGGRDDPIWHLHGFRSRGRRYVISGESLFHTGSPSISDEGLVLFNASLDADGKSPGIFRGPDPMADKIIGFGDELFGSTVVNVRLSGIDSFNRAFFDYVLADGRAGHRLGSRARAGVDRVASYGRALSVEAAPCSLKILALLESAGQQSGLIHLLT